MKKRSEKKKKGLIVAIFAVAIFMAAAYAALEATLTINAVGKIYSDWDVEFTDSVCDIDSEYTPEAGGLEMECFATASAVTLTEDDHIGQYLAGIVDDNNDGNHGTGALGGLAGIGGIELNLYTEFATPDDTTEFEIEVTNFSSMWDAVLMSIVHTQVSATDTAKDWIIYEFDGLKAVGGLIEPDATAPTILAAIGTGTTGDNITTFTITASWNEDYDGTVPDSAIKKEQEAANFTPPTGSETETYTQKDKFVLLWQAFAPGTYTP